jgi:indole-3-glycerol phosphate synthase
MIRSDRMTKFLQPQSNIKRLVENSFRAIDEGAYESIHSFSHDAISLKKAILSCSHAPLITEVKFSSPSHGKLRVKTEPAEVAGAMVSSGAVALSVLTQPYLFDGSIQHLAAVRKSVSVPLLMKDITVSQVQIDAAKKNAADCVLLIKTVFDRGLAEDSIEKLAEYAIKKDLQVLVEVHTEDEYGEVLKARWDLVGINNRNLDNLQVDIRNTEKLLSRHGKGKNIVISESGIAGPEDIKYLHQLGVDAFLVGTSIMEAEDLRAKVRELYNAI